MWLKRQLLFKFIAFKLETITVVSNLKPMTIKKWNNGVNNQVSWLIFEKINIKIISNTEIILHTVSYTITFGFFFFENKYRFLLGGLFKNLLLLEFLIYESNSFQL